MSNFPAFYEHNRDRPSSERCNDSESNSKIDSDNDSYSDDDDDGKRFLAGALLDS